MILNIKTVLQICKDKNLHTNPKTNVDLYEMELLGYHVSYKSIRKVNILPSHFKTYSVRPMLKKSSY